MINNILNTTLIFMCAYIITLRIRLANIKMELETLEKFVFRTIRNLSETDADLYKRIDDYGRRTENKIQK